MGKDAVEALRIANEVAASQTRPRDTVASPNPEDVQITGLTCTLAFLLSLYFTCTFVLLGLHSLCGFLLDEHRMGSFVRAAGVIQSVPSVTWVQYTPAPISIPRLVIRSPPLSHLP